MTAKNNNNNIGADYIQNSDHDEKKDKSDDNNDCHKRATVSDESRWQ